MRQFTRRVVESPVGSALLRAGESFTHTGPNAFRVLTFHRVLDSSVFRRQMEFVRQRHAVIDLESCLAVFNDTRALPANSVLLTFDDAYTCFRATAWPILRELKLPVTVFVPTAFPDSQKPYWWDTIRTVVGSHQEPEFTFEGRAYPLATVGDRKRTMRRLRERAKELPALESESFVDRLTQELGTSPPPNDTLSWDALRRLSEEGVTLAPHTRNHLIMTHLNAEECHREIATSIEDLERETGQSWPVLAYPAGRFHDVAVQAASRAGIQLAFTTQRGTNQAGQTDPLRLRRININSQAGLGVLRASLLESSERWPFRVMRRKVPTGAPPTKSAHS